MGAAESRIALRLFACLMVCAANAGYGFNLSEPSPGIFVHRGRQLALDVPGHDDIANIGFIVGRKCVAVIDTGGSMRIGRELRAAVAQHTALPVCYVINTHVHVDHVLGNAAFKSDQPSFVGHTALTQAMARSTEFFLAHYGGDLDSPPGADQIIAPDRVVENELTLDLGGRQLALRAWPTAHSDCDLTVYDGQTGTLWTGDLLFRERLPAVDGSVKGWLKVLDELARMRVRLAVPGHGPITRAVAAALVPERRYLQALTAGVRDELSRGKSPQDAIEHVAAAQKPHWLLWDSVHPHNVMRVIQELEWE
ncbi:MAG: quinoprotein relay system zinc metallohydrolase 2 [Gammaproteobacteria bacterium]